MDVTILTSAFGLEVRILTQQRGGGEGWKALRMAERVPVIRWLAPDGAKEGKLLHEKLKEEKFIDT